MKRLFAVSAVVLPLLFSTMAMAQPSVIWDLEECDGDMNGWYADHTAGPDIQLTRMSPTPAADFQTNMCAGGTAAGFYPPYTRDRGEVLLAVDVRHYALIAFDWEESGTRDISDKRGIRVTYRLGVRTNPLLWYNITVQLKSNDAKNTTDYDEFSHIMPGSPLSGQTLLSHTQDFLFEDFEQAGWGKTANLNAILRESAGLQFHVSGADGDGLANMVIEKIEWIEKGDVIDPKTPLIWALEGCESNMDGWYAAASPNSSTLPAAGDDWGTTLCAANGTITYTVGTSGAGDQWPYVVTGFDWLPNNAIVDISHEQGIYVTYSLTGAAVVAVQLKTPDGYTDDNERRVAMPVGAMQRRYFPFTNFVQESGWGIPRSLQSVLANSVGLQFHSKTHGTAILTVEKIEWPSTTAIAVTGRDIPPQVKFDVETSVISPVNTVSGGEFTAGPNPVARHSGIVNFFWQSRNIENTTLNIYDAYGKFVKRVRISDKAPGGFEKRIVGSWDLTDSGMRPVSEGAYVVKGTIKTNTGRKEKVSLIFSVR